MFIDHSSAGSGTFTNETASRPAVSGGLAYFFDASTAGNGTFVNEEGIVGGGGTIPLEEDSSAGSGSLPIIRFQAYKFLWKCHGSKRDLYLRRRQP